MTDTTNQIKIEPKTVLLSYKKGKNPAFSIALSKNRDIEPTQILEAVEAYYKRLCTEEVKASFIFEFDFSEIKLQIGDSERILTWTFLNTVTL